MRSLLSILSMIDISSQLVDELFGTNNLSPDRRNTTKLGGPANLELEHGTSGSTEETTVSVHWSVVSLVRRRFPVNKKTSLHIYMAQWE